MKDEDIARGKRPPKKEKARTPTGYVGPDGLKRPKKFEHDLNECFAIVFKSAAGQEVINHLKTITTGRVLPPGLSNNSYVYAEGARWLMGIISTRIKDGEDKKP